MFSILERCLYEGNECDSERDDLSVLLKREKLKGFGFDV